MCKKCASRSYYHNGRSRWSKCINSKCQNFKVEIRNDGEECFIDKDAKTIYDCKDGSVCYQCCAAYGDKSKCVPKVKAKKGESCSNPLRSSDPISVSNYKMCESGLYCKTMSDGSQICTEPLLKGANCANTTTACEAGTMCRQNSPSDIGMSCQPVAALGESCVVQSDCAYGPSYLVRCYNNKCQRMYGARMNEICKKDEECYTSYCSSEGKCAERTAPSCSSTANCQVGSSCACGGKGSSNTPGKCVESCYGASIDAATCLYNLGMTIAVNYYYGLGPTQFVDEDSSAFTKCRFAFSRYNSCVRKSWIAAGISTKGDMPGIDLDAYSIYANPIMPERNGANQNQFVFGLIFAIMMLINFIF